MRMIPTMLLLMFLTSCATFPGRQPARKQPPASARVKSQDVTPSQAPAVPRETMRPESTDYASVQTPKRQVSTQLVTQGKEYLDKKDYDHARGRLEEAIVVDPTNGSAYYHLAVVYYNLNDFPKALGFLDQAETLLHNSPEWMETIQKFREMLR